MTAPRPTQPPTAAELAAVAAFERAMREQGEHVARARNVLRRVTPYPRGVTPAATDVAPAATETAWHGACKR